MPKLTYLIGFRGLLFLLPAVGAILAGRQALEVLVGILGLALAVLAYQFKLYKVLFLVLLASIFISFELPLGSSTKLVFPSEPLVALLTLVLLIKLAVRVEVRTGHFNFISVGVGILLLSYCLGTLGSTMPMVSAKFSLVNMAYILSAFVGSYWLFQSDKLNLKLLLEVCALPLGLVAIYALLNHSVYGFAPGAAAISARPFFKDHTIWGAALALFIPLYLYYFFNFRSKEGRFSLWPLALLMLLFFALLVSSSRAAWLGLLAAGVLWLLISMGMGFRALAFLLLVAGIGVLSFQKSIVESLFINVHNATDTSFDIEDQLKSVSNVQNDISNLERLNRWSCALRMFEDRPASGFGPGTYQFQYLPYQQEHQMTEISVTNPFDIKDGRGGSAHSEYLLLLSENGFTGLLSWLMILFGASYYLLRDVATNEDKLARRTSLAVFLALSTYFVHALFNNFLNTPSIGISFWTLIGYAYHKSTKKITL